MAVFREWGRIASSYDKQLRSADQNATSIKADAVRDEHSFRNEYQLRHTRREWDLNRPDAKLLDRPAREGDEDERCGISSMQVLYISMYASALKNFSSRVLPSNALNGVIWQCICVFVLYTWVVAGAKKWACPCRDLMERI